jgi:hypothetical protein
VHIGEDEAWCRQHADSLSRLKSLY